MEIQMRIVFLVTGLLILFGVAVDVYRRKNLTKSDNTGSSRHRRPSNKNQSDLFNTTQISEDYAIENVYAADAIEATPYVTDYTADELEYNSDDEDVLIDIAHPGVGMSESRKEQHEEAASIQDVIAIFIMSRSPYGFNGDELYTAISNAHLHLGKNNLFYRYAKDDGTGEPLFSLVKAVEPGYFNVDVLRQEHVPGVTLLLLPSKLSDPLLALDKLIRAAKQITFTLNGELLDHTRRSLTLDTIEKYKQQIQTINA